MLQTPLGKIAVVLMLFIGEALMIYAELVAAQNAPSFSRHSLGLYARLYLLLCVSSALLLMGYAIGAVSFRDIWFVALASILSILIVEPPLVYYMFEQPPSKGAIIGFLCGVAGFAAALLL